MLTGQIFWEAAGLDAEAEAETVPLCRTELEEEELDLGEKRNWSWTRKQLSWQRRICAFLSELLEPDQTLQTLIVPGQKEEEASFFRAWILN